MTAVTPEGCSCSALRQAARHVTRFYDRALKPVSLGLNQYSILAKLVRSGPMPVHALAELLVMDRSTVGHLLRPLRARGLVRVEVGADDRRSRVVALTRRGEELMSQARPLWARAERRFQRSFGRTDAHDLRSELKRITLTQL